MRPGSAVETFHHASIFEVGIVVDGHIRHISAFAHRALHDLAQGLQAIECAAGVISENAHAALVDGDAICARHGFDAVFDSFFCIEVHFKFCTFVVKSDAFGCEHVKLLTETLFLVGGFETAAHIERAIGFYYLMWGGVDNQPLMVDFLARDSHNILLLTALRTQVEFAVLSHGIAAKHSARCQHRE